MNAPGVFTEMKNGLKCGVCGEAIEDGEEAVRAEHAIMDGKDPQTVNHAGIYHRGCFE